MAETFIGDIRMWPINRIPRGWAACDGQLLAINQNQALYAILGTTYGGNGQTTFALPDLRGRVPVHVGNGISFGQAAGETAHTLTVNEMPQHTHLVMASLGDATISSMAPGNYWAANNNTYAPPANTVAMSAAAVSQAGGSQPHENMQPYTAVCFCIAITGYFPTRN